MTQLLGERRAISERQERFDEAYEAALAEHDPFQAHPGQVGILSPWLNGCPDCERMEANGKKSGALLLRNFELNREIADASEEGHTKRLAGLQKAATIRSKTESPAVLAVRRYCKDRSVPFTKRKLSYQIHHELKIPLRTVQHALRAIIKK